MPASPVQSSGEGSSGVVGRCSPAQARGRRVKGSADSRKDEGMQGTELGPCCIGQSKRCVRV